MRSLYLRIYVTVVAALALFALGAGWLVQRHLDEQRSRAEAVVRERMAAWGDLIQRSLPPADAPLADQEAALRDWSQRLRLPMALDGTAGQRIATSESFLRRELDNPGLINRLQAIRLDDGRTLWVPRGGGLRAAARLAPGILGGPGGLDEHGPGGPGGPAGPGGPGEPGGRDGRFGINGLGGSGGPGGLGRGGPPDARALWLLPHVLPEGVGLAALLVVIFIAVAGGAWPVVRRLTRRLESLKQGVEAFGAGALHQRVAEEGHDEVAAVGASFNRAATRIEALLRSHQSLLANASHELRSPLARLKMAVSLLEDAPEAQRAKLRQEITTNIGELDALVEEVLLASRLDAAATLDCDEAVSLLPLAAEEAARVGASAQGDDVQARGDERLLRRALRNLLENARRYGGDAVEVDVLAGPDGPLLRVSDRGPGVPVALRERIFEAFFRLPGHAEREGGVGLGLALVRQIALRHGGSVQCLPRPGGGSCFELRLRNAGPPVPTRATRAAVATRSP